MCWLSVYIQLVVLVIVDEATALFEDRKVGIVALRKLVKVVPVRQLGTHFNRLTVGGVKLSHRVNIRPVAFLTAFAQPDLRLAKVALQVVVYHVEVLEGRELRIGRERRFDEELALLRVDVEPVARVYADALAHASDESVHLFVEVRGVVYDVEVRVADPRSRCVVVQLPSELHAF